MKVFLDTNVLVSAFQTRARTVWLEIPASIEASVAFPDAPATIVWNRASCWTRISCVGWGSPGARRGRAS